VSSKLDADALKKGTAAEPATARANSVLPVPGGPTSNTPFGARAPSDAYLQIPSGQCCQVNALYNLRALVRQRLT
jgi:hypothetical protein